MFSYGLTYEAGKQVQGVGRSTWGPAGAAGDGGVFPQDHQQESSTHVSARHTTYWYYILCILKRIRLLYILCILKRIRLLCSPKLIVVGQPSVPHMYHAGCYVVLVKKKINPFLSRPFTGTCSALLLDACLLTFIHRLEPPGNDSYETEIARLARANPEVLEIQQRSGLNREDMEACMAQLKLLREKVSGGRSKE